MFVKIILIILFWIFLRSVIRVISSVKRNASSSSKPKDGYEHLTDQEISDADYEEIEKK